MSEHQDVPWPFFTLKHAARVLGCDPVMLSGLANNPIRACKRPGKTGIPVLLFNREDILAIKARVKSS